MPYSFVNTALYRTIMMMLGPTLRAESEVPTILPEELRRLDERLRQDETPANKARQT